MPTRYNIEFFEQSDMKLYYPINMSLNNPPKEVAFGSTIVAAKCERQPNGRNILSISKGLAEKLHLPDFIRSIYIFENEDLFVLGPLVGIFSSGFTPYQIKPIGERSSLFSKLLSVQSSVGVIPFLFGEQHIDWDHGMIEGFFYSKDGWETWKVPFPNVIYDRLPNRRSESLRTSKNVKDKLKKEYLIPWYNPGFFNKLDVYERLLQNDVAEKYLPETFPFTSFHQIEQMLSKYGHVYIKPISGSLGLGVHQILFDHEEQLYFCRYHDSINHLVKFKSLEALMNRIFGKKKLSRMIVQQGIHLLRFEHLPVDFRVHVNKDKDGKWKVSAIAAKVAGIGSPTTHVNNGGKIKTLNEIFLDADICKQYQQKLETASLDLANVIEDQMEGIIGEIGFDFGIDTKGDIWLFEANSKPGRSIFSHPNLKEFDILTRKLSLSFAVFLTEKAIKKPEELFL
jgi:hypothetical protein